MYLTHIGIQREFRGMNVVPGVEEIGGTEPEPNQSS